MTVFIAVGRQYILKHIGRVVLENPIMSQGEGYSLPFVEPESLLQFRNSAPVVPTHAISTVFFTSQSNL
jgi:hypothetical protein